MRFRRFLIPAAMFLCALSARAQLTADDVQQVINQATKRANKIAPNSVIAVTNREGYVLGIWSVRGGEPGVLETAVAVGKAGTASFLSSNANAFTTRTAGFIIQQHFPPGVRNLPPGPLVGVGFSNLPFSDVNRFKKADFIPGSASPGTLGSPIPLTSLNGIPGGVPLYKNGVLVGGIGVTGAPFQLVNGIGTSPSGIEFPPTLFIGGPTKDEDIALAGQRGYEPDPEIHASNVFINGIGLPYVESNAGSISGAAVTGNASAQYPVIGSPLPFPYPRATFAGVEGQIRQTIMADPLSTTINGEPRLTQAEVEAIIASAADRVRTTRAGIRLPIGTRMEVFITVVNNPNVPGVGPTVLGAFRTGDATIFSWDVAVQKARSALNFSSNTRAFSTRTIGFLAQSNFPPGIDPESPGPLNGMQEELSGFVRSELPELAPTAALTTPPFTPPDPMFPNGLTIFPGGFPLYRNGQLVGAIGISGDGVDQDDIVGVSGTAPFPAPGDILADRTGFEGTRLPYVKFPRDPEGVDRITPVVLPTFAALGNVFADLANLSVRLNVGTGENLMIGGFIIEGTTAKRVVIRALGPSLAAAGISDPLADPVLILRDATGAALAQNNDWRETQESELVASGLAPASPLEAAIVQTLEPGAYTASMTGRDEGSGVGLVEIYDVATGSASKLANLSARGFVGVEDKIMIGGFIVRGNGAATRLLLRASGPSLSESGIADPLADPFLEIRDSNGELLAVNDNWRETQEADIGASLLAPSDERESATVVSAPPGAYTSILRGAGGATGVALLELYRLP